ncbi:MAG: nucleotidyltransferase [Coprobacillus sp.]
MRVLGIIVEYNPFHNGHIHHIEQAKQITCCDYTIAVMSSSFVQRGEPAIIDKWQRSRLAIDYGVDLVIELPFVYSCQSADYFSKGALSLLNAIGVTDICFGSEDGNIETFLTIANAIETYKDEYNQYVKAFMQEGLRYPDACNKALQIIVKQDIRTPNDLLGLGYVKEIVSNHYPITPHCFKRTNDYHSQTIETIASASAIRKAIHDDIAYQSALPQPELYQQETYFLDAFFPYLKYQILLTPASTLAKYHLVEEGLENVMKNEIEKSSSTEEFIQSLLSKRYTRPRIQRMLIHVLMKNTKEDIQNAMNIDYLRILAMSQKGRRYLNSIKKDCSFHLITRLGAYKHLALDIEFKATKLLSLISSAPLETIKKEYQSIPYIKED